MDLYVTWQVAALILVTAAAGLTTVVVLARIHGLRSFAKMAPHDFATTIAIGSVLAGTAMASVPLFQGLAALAALFGVQHLFQRWRMRGGSAVLDNDPVLLMRGSEVRWEALRSTGITVDDLRGKLREANVLDYGQVRAVVLESTGDVSVLHGGADEPRLDPDLLEGVQGLGPEAAQPASWLGSDERPPSPLSTPGA